MTYKRKGDFTPKYNDVDGIEKDYTLLPSEKVREKVKHYAMCLFGLATDMANCEQALIDKQTYITALENENKALRSKYQQFIERHRKGESVVEKELRNELAKERAKTKHRINKMTSAERQAVQADFYEKRIHDLQCNLNSYKNKCKRLEQALERQGRSDGK